MQINLSERELYVIVNALNYASGEWANCDDVELARLSDDADELEARLQQRSGVTMPTNSTDIVSEARRLAEYIHDLYATERTEQTMAAVRALCDEVERLRDLVDEWETAASAAFQEDTNGVY